MSDRRTPFRCGSRKRSPPRASARRARGASGDPGVPSSAE
jgi:hypothetical protein